MMSVAEALRMMNAWLAVTPSADGALRAWLHPYATTARNIHWN